jgi:hypothetical protein
MGKIKYNVLVLSLEVLHILLDTYQKEHFQFVPVVFYLSKDNNMFINCNKTKCITVGTKQKLAFQNEELYLTINNQLKAKCNLNKKVALIQGLNIS